MEIGKILILLVIVVAPTSIFVILKLDSSKKKTGKKTKRFLLTNKAHNFLSRFFMTSRGYAKVVQFVARTNVYNLMEVRASAIKFYAVSTGAAVVVFIVGAFSTKDLLDILIIFAYAMLMKTSLVNKRIDDINFSMLKQLSATLSSFCEAYTLYGTIPDAVANCKKGPLVEKAFDAIYIILTSTESEKKLDEFLEITPLKNLQTFATTCFTLSREGDTEGNNSGIRVALSILKREVDGEITRLTKQRILFNFLEYMPLAPICCIGVVESFFIANIPGTATLYNGLLGYISRLITVLFSVIGYYVITTINSPSSVKEDDRMPMISKLLRMPWFLNIVHNVMPKKAKSTDKLTMQLSGALSLKTKEYIYACKVVVSGMAFILSIIAMIFMVSASKRFLYNNIKSISLSGGIELTIDEEARMYELDCEYLATTPRLRTKDLENKIGAAFPEMYDMDIAEQAERMEKKYDSYYNTYFRWWFILIAYGIAIGAWFSPVLMVKLRKYLVRAEALEDVMQMQTLIAILMHTQMDTLEVLYWLDKQSNIHNNVLSYAYLSYPSAPEETLEWLADQSELPEFVQLVERLIYTVSDISLAEAFSDLLSEKEQTLKIREMVQDASLMKKRQLASPLALASLYAMIAGHVLAPIGILGVVEFVKVMGQL